MRERVDTLSQAQRQVAAAMLDGSGVRLRANVDALARRAKVSPPTIIRFCRALGFAGLREFKLRLAQSLAVGKSTLHRAVVPGDNMQAVTHKVLQGAVSALANLERHIVAGGSRARRHADRQGAASRLLRAWATSRCSWPATHRHAFPGSAWFRTFISMRICSSSRRRR